MSMQNQNLFALLPYDAEDVDYIAPPTEAPAAEEKKKQPNATTHKSKPDKKKTGHQDASVRSNGYYPSRNGSWGNNRVADGSGSNYRGSSYQSYYNGEQRGRGHAGRGRGNGGGGRSFNEYSNGKQLDTHIKGNQSGEAESLNKPLTGDGQEAWQVVSRLSRASSVASEGRSELSLSYNPDKKGPYRKGNEDESNDNAMGNVVETEEERIRREEWEKDMEERRIRRLMWEEERKKKTLKQYYEEKGESAPKQTRIAALDKELEAMQLVGKKTLPLGKQGSDSVSSTYAKSDKNKGKKDNAGPKDACKSIVEVLLKPSRYQPQRPQRYIRGPNPKGDASNGFSDKGAPVKGNPSDKGFKDSHLKGKGKETTVEGSNPKGTAAIVVRSEDREAVESKAVKRAVHVDLKFDDATQFPALK